MLDKYFGKKRFVLTYTLRDTVHHGQENMASGVTVCWSHWISKWGRAIKLHCHLQVTYFFQQASTSQRLYSLPKQNVPLRTKRANIWDGGRLSMLKSQQGPDLQLLWIYPEHRVVLVFQTLNYYVCGWSLESWFAFYPRSPPAKACWDSVNHPLHNICPYTCAKFINPRFMSRSLLSNVIPLCR